MEVGDLRLIKEGSQVWSISNQSGIILVRDTVVKIKHTTHEGDTIFVKPQDVLFEHTGIPGIINKGTDEWHVRVDDTEHYELPGPSIFTFKYD